MRSLIGTYEVKHEVIWSIWVLIIGWIQVDEVYFWEFPQKITGILAPYLNIPCRLQPHWTLNFNSPGNSVQCVPTFTTPTTSMEALEDPRSICVNACFYQEWSKAVWFELLRDTPLNVIQHTINSSSIFRSIKLSLLGRIHLCEKPKFIWTPIHFINVMNNIIGVSPGGGHQKTLWDDFTIKFKIIYIQFLGVVQ